jgi:EmrB/QacA subfamily drug resistance transporter
MFAKLPCDDLGAGSGPCREANTRSAHWALVAAVLGSTLASLDATGVNVSLPTLQREFSTTPAAVQWIIEGYALFLSALILTCGALGDRFGRRRVFALGSAGFGLASLGCGLAPSIEFLIAARCVQGIAAALMVPGSLALISGAFDEKARGAAIGTWAGATAVSSALGPALGGWLTQAASWRWIFLINVPLAAAIVIISLLRVAETRDDASGKHFDVPGAILATLGLGGLTYGFVQLQAPDANRVLCTATIVAGLLFLAAFARVQATSATPMIPRELFSNRDFIAANVYTFLLYAAMGGALYFVPFALQFALGYSPLASGLALLPFVVVYSLGSRFAGAFFSGPRVRLALAIGPLLQMAGLVTFSFAHTSGSYWFSFFPGALLLGAGAAIFVAPLTTLAMNSAGAHVGTGSGVNNAVARAAGLLATAMLGTAVYVSFHTAVSARVAQPVWSPAARAAVHDRFDRIAALETPDSVPPAERDRFRLMLRESYLLAFRVGMLLSGALALLATIYWLFATRSGTAATSRRSAMAR